MEVEGFLELARKLDREEKGRGEEAAAFRRLFDRFHLLNRNYLDRETFEQASGSISSMAETIANTLQYLDREIAHLRSKRMRLPLETRALSEMQKVQNRNEMLIREFIARHRE